MVTSVYLRLAGPQQSWSGPRLSAHTVETLPTPTRSALTGMIAAACGFPRGEWAPWLTELEFEVRVDNPGHRLNDYQIITPALHLEAVRLRLWKALTAGTKLQHKGSVFNIGSQGNAVLIAKHSITGADMLVRVGHPDRTEEILAALANPVYSPFLGRKAFVPSFPFLLGIGPDDLLDSAPALRRDTADEVRLPVYPAGNHAEANPARTVEVPALPRVDQLAWWTANASLELETTP